MTAPCPPPHRSAHTVRFSFSLSLLGSLCFAGASLTASAQIASTTSFAHPALSAPLVVAAAPAAFSSSVSENDPAAEALPSTEAALPEAPVPQLATEPKPKQGTSPEQHVASKLTLTIPSDWKAQPLTARDKVEIGLRDLYSYENFAAMIFSAGYEQLLNSQPNYGTDKGAFGQRLGAAAIRETTQGVFTEVILAPLLHEDPRFYVKGPRYSPVHRTLYAITRPVVSRKDDGSPTINGSLLLGYAASAAVGPLYYPQQNRNFHDALSVYAGSLGGSALGYFINEFSRMSSAQSI